MEQLLHYIWKHKIFPLRRLETTDGLSVEVIDPGLHNGDAGPDFFNAKVRIGGTMWVGNIEIHDRSSDWYTHGHHRDSRYDNVILHIAATVDSEVRTSNGNTLPQMRLEVPPGVSSNYERLLHEDRYPPCHKLIPDLPSISVHSWMSALQTERLEQKTEAIYARVARCDGSWEDAFFVTLARNYGFGTNSEAFETWALNMPMTHIGRHRDDIFQTEALFLGQAGLLSADSMPERQREAALSDGYFVRLSGEYRYLAHKFSLTPTDFRLWKFLRLRPQNFPHIRIAQLASLYHSRRTSLSMIAECPTLDGARRMLTASVTPYWRTHYTFGHESRESAKTLSRQSVDLLIINTVVPMLFAYGRHLSSEEMCWRATDFLEQLAPERNNIVRMWEDCGLEVQNAGDTQALIQLKKNYCDRKDCLRCRFGYEYLSRRDAPAAKVTD